MYDIHVCLELENDVETYTDIYCWQEKFRFAKKKKKGHTHVFAIHSCSQEHISTHGPVPVAVDQRPH